MNGDAETVSLHRSEFVELYHNNVRVHEYEKGFSIYDAEKKIIDLQHYLRNGKAYLFYISDEDIITAFMWAHPIDYKNNHRIYIHAYGTKPQYRERGYASLLYKHITTIPFQEKELYTHVDASNIVSCHIQDKYGFIPEVVQYAKRVLE